MKLTFWGKMSALAAVVFSKSLAAQTLPPPPPPAPPPPPPAAEPLSDADGAEGDEPTLDDPSGVENAPAQEDEQGPGDGDNDEATELELEQERRVQSRRLQPSITGSSGLLRTQYAASGAVGTLRFGILSSYMSSTEFLCPQCPDPDGGPADVEDEVSRIGAHVHLSATPWDFLEAYLGIHSSATSNSQGDPELLQVLADTRWGAKAFSPVTDTGTLSLGGFFELLFLNGAGSVGVDNTSVALGALGTYDPTKKAEPRERLPLRVNFGLSYVFDNSGGLVEEIESSRQRRVDRIERFGLNVNRLDRIVPAFGVEGVFDAVHPFLEWSGEIPANRQDYSCIRNDLYASDVCMKDALSFSSMPSRLTLGAKGYVLLDGLSLLGALEIGTGGTAAPFWEEMQPESPWNLYFGAAYAADTVPQVEVRRVDVPSEDLATSARVRLVEGVVFEAGQENLPVPNAILRYQNHPFTGMVTDDQGRFRTGNLPPGQYTFSVSAEYYEDGNCTVTVPEVATAGADADPEAGADAAADEAAPGAPEREQLVVAMRCELTALPKVGSIDGYLLAGLGRDPVPMANVTIANEQGQQLTMQADKEGTFVVTNVPQGRIRISASAEGYLQSSMIVDIEIRKSVQAQLQLFKKPQRPSVRETKDGLKLSKQLEFVEGKAELEPTSLGLLDEIAALLRNKPEMPVIEIQGHTSSTGSPETAIALGAARANAILAALVINGVAASRLTAKGLGDSQPIAGKDSKRNERIEFVFRTELAPPPVPKAPIPSDSGAAAPP